MYNEKRKYSQKCVQDGYMKKDEKCADKRKHIKKSAQRKAHKEMSAYGEKEGREITYGRNKKYTHKKAV